MSVRADQKLRHGWRQIEMRHRREDARIRQVEMKPKPTLGRQAGGHE
ncbi:MAG: hypothetical protein AB7M05_01040 [Alphaproteobacteria bacterium]